MTVITKISVGKKNKHRYNIYIDQGNGEEYGFSVSEEVLIKMNLKKGKTIDQLEAMEIAYQEDIQKALSLSFYYLSHRMRSEYEVTTYLKEKEYEGHTIKEVIHKLYELKYLDDVEFAKAFVSTKVNAGDKGPIVIKQELKQKGIQDDISEKALLQYSEEQQLQHAKKIAEKLLNKKGNSSAVEQKRKAEQTLIRKGYPSYIIEKAIGSVEYSQDENEEWESLLKQGEKAHRKFQKYDGFQYAQKMKSSLYRKGFPLELIERYLDEVKHSEGE